MFLDLETHHMYANLTTFMMRLHVSIKLSYVAKNYTRLYRFKAKKKLWKELIFTSKLAPVHLFLPDVVYL